MSRDKEEKEPDERNESRDGEQDRPVEPSDFISGAINILGLRIDLGELLGSPENLKGRLEELRENLKTAGGKEVLSDQEWGQGGASITGHIRTRGLLGEREFHIGTTGQPGGGRAQRPAPEPPETVEPPMDVFDEGSRVVIVADVPGATLDDLDLKVSGEVFSLASRPAARRRYRKELRLEHRLAPDRLEATCNNGVLEVRIPKRTGEEG